MSSPSKPVYAVITDIDDSIKISKTSSILGYIFSTLCTFRPVPGMPSFFNFLAIHLKAKRFIYISAAPLLCYPILYMFIRIYFPPGCVALQPLSWVSPFFHHVSGDLDYKIKRISDLYVTLSKNKVICIGDNLRMDPEIYGEIYRKFPGWICKIFIRKLGTTAANIEEERFKKAFEGIPHFVWDIFENAQELYDKAQRLLEP